MRLMNFRRLLLAICLVLLGVPAFDDALAAEPIVPLGWSRNDIDPRSGLTPNERQAVQSALMWAGVYSGPHDGEWSTPTEMALRSWRSTIDLPLDPRLSRAEVLTLFVQAKRAQAEAGWTSGKDPNTGFWFGWPSHSMKPPMPVRDGDSYGSDYEQRGAAGLRLMTRVTTVNPRNLLQTLQTPAFVGAVGSVRVISHVDDPDQQAGMLVASSGVSIYFRYDRVGPEWHGFTIIGLTATAPLWLIGPMNTEFTASADPPLSPLDKATAPVLAEVASFAANPQFLVAAGAKLGAAPQVGLRATGSGTAFVIGRNGAMLTNAHVVNGCQQLRLADETAVTLVATDPKRDLALVKAAHGFPAALNFRREQTLDHGEEVRVFGFPYYRLVSESLNITEGIVTSLTGLQGNPVQFQMSANLQPGNSGGPVLDESGNVIGVSVAVLNSLAVARLTGTMPQGMNYAVRGSEAAAFLEEHGTEVGRGTGGHARSLRDIVKMATPLVFPLLCYN